MWESANPAQAAQGDSSGGGSVQDTLDFKQLVGGVFDTTGRRRLSQAAASAPRGECVAVSVITLQMLYPDNNSADMQWNSVCTCSCPQAPRIMHSAANLRACPCVVL